MSSEKKTSGKETREPLLETCLKKYFRQVERLRIIKESTTDLVEEMKKMSNDEKAAFERIVALTDLEAGNVIFNLVERSSKKRKQPEAPTSSTSNNNNNNTSVPVDPFSAKRAKILQKKFPRAWKEAQSRRKQEAVKQVAEFLTKEEAEKVASEIEAVILTIREEWVAFQGEKPRKEEIEKMLENYFDSRREEFIKRKQEFDSSKQQK